MRSAWTLKERFAHSQKILDLRICHLQRVPEAEKIRRIYQLERQMMERLSKHGKDTLAKE